MKIKSSFRVNDLLKAIIISFLSVCICVIWILPIVGLFISSLRPRHLISTTPWWDFFSLPMVVTFDNYKYVLLRLGMAQGILNTIIITIPSTILPILIAILATYVLELLAFRGKKILFGCIIVLLVFPTQMSLIPLLRFMSSVRLSGTFPAVWIVHTGFALPYAVYVSRSFIRGIPRDLIDSARIDGASHCQIFYKIVLPLALYAIASLAIFQFMWTWNDLLIALIFLGTGTEIAPMTAIISRMTDTRGGGWEYYTAAAFIQIAIPMGIFIFLQKYYVSGLLDGSIRE